MRFVGLMLVLAAFWVQPAKAVSIQLTAPDASQGVHQKITLTGLTAVDSIDVLAGTGFVTSYWWEDFPGIGKFVDGNEAAQASCSTIGNRCNDGFALFGVAAPAKAMGYVNIDIVDQMIFVDWAKVSTYLCNDIPEDERVPSFRSCGFRWNNPRLNLIVNVAGPSSDTYGYSVETIGTFSVPEPSTWVLIIVGVGLVGTVMRRKTLRPIRNCKQTARLLV